MSLELVEDGGGDWWLFITNPAHPGDNDGVYLPVAGYKRSGTFDEKDRMPIQVVSYGPKTS